MERTSEGNMTERTIRLNLNIETGNAEFCDDPQEATASALERLAVVIRRGDLDSSTHYGAEAFIRDVNGNTVGKARFSQTD
jgi:hypothetical protein